MFNQQQIIILLLYVISYGNATRTKDKMYEQIDGSRACFRRVNGTHQVGCTSNRGGSTGIIHYCAHQSDLDFVLRNGTAGDDYVPVIPTYMFTVANVHACKSSGKVSGLVLFIDHNSSRPNADEQYFTHDNQCPNYGSNFENTCGGDTVLWNPYGTGMLYHDIPFPVFYVENVDKIAAIRACFERHNSNDFETQRDRSLCSLQLISFMYATTDTPTCIRRSNSVTNLNPVKFCDPLGDLNVWATLFPLLLMPNSSTVENENRRTKYIVVAAKLDSTTMFDKTAGAITPITGLVTLLATAKLLKQLLPEYKNDYENTNVLFVLFNGETYDYIGSQRFLYDVLHDNFPFTTSINNNNNNSRKKASQLPSIKLDDIALYVELSQLSNSGTVVAHYYQSKPKIKDFLLSLNSNKADLINFDESLGSLPPGSLHTFLRNQSNFPGIILADHKTAYANHYYHSIYDNASNLNYIFNDDNAHSIQRFTANLSRVIAKSIYHQITDGGASNNISMIIVDDDDDDLRNFINELYSCYLIDPNCRVHQAIQKFRTMQTEPFSLYVGVEVVPNFITSLIGLTLGWVTGDVVGEGDANCTNDRKNYAYKYYNMSKSIDDLNTTLCYRITMNFTDAISPAFIIKDYDWSSGLYSTWAESTWSDIKIRMFLKPSAAHENMTIAIGSIVLMFSFFIVYFVKSRSDILFQPPIVPTLVAPTNC